jgi:hypothetical protein
MCAPIIHRAPFPLRLFFEQPSAGVRHVERNARLKPCRHVPLKFTLFLSGRAEEREPSDSPRYDQTESPAEKQQRVSKEGSTL